MINKTIGTMASGTPKDTDNTPAPHQRVIRLWLIKFIAERVEPAYDSFLDARNSVRLRIKYATTKSHKLAPAVEDKLVFGDVVRWARQIPKWHDLLAGLPENPAEIPKPVLHRVSAEIDIEFGNTNLTCADQLDEARASIGELEEQLKVALCQRDGYRKDAEARRQNTAKNRLSGALGGRPKGSKRPR